MGYLRFTLCKTGFKTSSLFEFYRVCFKIYSELDPEATVSALGSQPFCLLQCTETRKESKCSGPTFHLLMFISLNNHFFISICFFPENI